MSEYQDPRLARGWGRQQVQAPVSIVKNFRIAAEREGYGGVKVLGTAALAVFLGAPRHVQDAVIEWAMIASRRDPHTIDPKEAWGVALDAHMRHQIHLSSRGDLSRQEEFTHYVARILDPELTPPPGEKASDRSAAKKKYV